MIDPEKDPFEFEKRPGATDERTWMLGLFLIGLCYFLVYVVLS